MPAQQRGQQQQHVRHHRPVGPTKKTKKRGLQERPELTKRPPDTHKGTKREHHAALGRAADGRRSGLNPSVFSDPPCSAPHMGMGQYLVFCSLHHFICDLLIAFRTRREFLAFHHRDLFWVLYMVDNLIDSRRFTRLTCARHGKAPLPDIPQMTSQSGHLGGRLPTIRRPLQRQKCREGARGQRHRSVIAVRPEIRWKHSEGWGVEPLADNRRSVLSRQFLAEFRGRPISAFSICPLMRIRRPFR